MTYEAYVVSRTSTRPQVDSAWDMLRERRSIEELEELLKERLEIIKSRRRGS